MRRAGPTAGGTGNAGKSPEARPLRYGTPQQPHNSCIVLQQHTAPQLLPQQKTEALRLRFQCVAGGCYSLLLCAPLIADAQLMTAFFAAAGQYFAAIGGLHALTETVCGFTAAL